jgi:hypothetical protein
MNNTPDAIDPVLLDIVQRAMPKLFTYDLQKRFGLLREQIERSFPESDWPDEFTE